MKLFVLALAATTLAGQTASVAQTLDAARAAMASARFCFLITVDESGQPRARLMEAFAPDEKMTIWFGTNPATRKVGQIRKNQRVTVAYYDPAGPNTVTLAGKARVVDNAAEKKKHWRDGWDTFFPGGPSGANYTVIEFVPDQLELISNSKNIGNAPATLLPAILIRSGNGWKPAAK
ncbi:MAG: pyridoxamine 5'-phosphate oxidase family protein [Acidobacteria bacterium]|nr:pyridoxamine 5'-phosphate oxidase family protein [Acidobacteriota bacterium]